MKARLQAIAQAFAELKTTIHPDHQPKAAALAVMIEQAHDAADEPTPPATIDMVSEKLELATEEIAELRETLTHQADELRDLGDLVRKIAGA